jgi:hypothetical protein
MSAFVMALALAITVGSVLYLLAVMVREILSKSKDPRTSPFKDFGLSIVLAILFFSAWIGQGLSQWQRFADEQRSHNEPIEVGDFTFDFLQSTLENWQSEFLQLFSFVVLSAVLIHRGSAESKDSDERMEEALKRIEKRLERLEEGSKATGP